MSDPEAPDADATPEDESAPTRPGEDPEDLVDEGGPTDPENPTG